MTFTVSLFVTDRGREVVADFIRKLPKRDQAAVYSALELLREFGPKLTRPDAGFLRDGLWELVCGKHARLIYFHAGGPRYVVVHGFWKTVQKTPRREIETAQQRRGDYLAREREGRK